MRNEKEIIEFFQAMLTHTDKSTAVASTITRFAPLETDDWKTVFNIVLGYISRISL